MACAFAAEKVNPGVLTLRGRRGEGGTVLTVAVSGHRAPKENPNTSRKMEAEFTAIPTARHWARWYCYSAVQVLTGAAVGLDSRLGGAQPEAGHPVSRLTWTLAIAVFRTYGAWESDAVGLAQRADQRRPSHWKG